MEKNKMHKIDKVFIVGIGFIATLSALIDVFYWKDVDYGVFPVFSCVSIFASYVLMDLLLIYSSLKYKEKNTSPNMLDGLCVSFYHFYILLL